MGEITGGTRKHKSTKCGLDGGQREIAVQVYDGVRAATTRLTDRNIEWGDGASLEMFRSMTAEQKFQSMSRMHAFARRWVEAVVREAHPNWPEADIRQEMARRLSTESFDGPR